MTTLNLQVGASTDDGGRYTGSLGFSTTRSYPRIGYSISSSYYHQHAFFRWLGVSIAGTIDAAYIEIYRRDTATGAPLLKVYGVDEDNPAAPTTAGEFDADPLTGVAVDWDGVWASGWNQSPSLVGIFQALVDAYTISGDAVMVQVKNDGGAVNQFNWWFDYSIDTAKAAKLDIDYSEPFVTGAATLSGAGSMSAAASLTLPAKAAISGIGSMSVLGTLGTIKSGAVALSGVGSMAVVAVITASGKAVISGVGSMAVAGEKGLEARAAMSGVGSMSAIGEVAGLLEGRAAISGVGSMSVIGERTRAGKVALSGVGSMAVSAFSTLSGKVAMSGIGSMTVIGETGAVLYTQFGGVLREIDPDDWPTGAEFFLEVVLAASGGTARARLYNLTDAAEVASSELTTANIDPTRLRTSVLSLSSGARDYRVEYGGAVDGIYTVYSADLLVESD